MTEQVHESVLLDTWLADVLKDIAPVYSDIAPPDVPDEVDGEPNVYIIFTNMNPQGGLDVRPVGGEILWHEGIYAVMAVARTDSYLDLGSAASAIHTALDNAFAGLEGGNIVWSRREGTVRYTETTDGKVYRRMGGLYVIQVRSENNDS